MFPSLDADLIRTLDAERIGGCPGKGPVLGICATWGSDAQGWGKGVNVCIAGTVPPYKKKKKLKMIATHEAPKFRKIGNRIEHDLFFSAL